jgi:hypothetical protein
MLDENFDELITTHYTLECYSLLTLLWELTVALLTSGLLHLEFAEPLSDADRMSINSLPL